MWALEAAFTSAHHCTTGARKAELPIGCSAVAALEDGSFAFGGLGGVLIFDAEGMGRTRTLTRNVGHRCCPNASGNCTAILDHPSAKFVRALVALGSGVASGCDDGAVRLWTAEGLPCGARISGPFLHRG